MRISDWSSDVCSSDRLGCRRFGGGVRIEVRDSGPGIAEKQAAQVFEPFFRLENEVRPRERGLGLGLAYARRLAELAGDSLTLTGRPGRGCRSEERRVGKECVRKWRSWWWPDH